MRLFRTLAPIVAVACISLGGVAASVSANGGGHGGGGGGSTPGVLEAGGDGIAAAAGKMSIHICAEEGILLAKGKVSIADDAYDGEVTWLGLHVYFDFDGCADVGAGAPEIGIMSGGGGGGKAAALVVGTGLTLRAEGTGIAFLKGDGTWANGNGESGDWSEDGAVLNVGGKQKPPCGMGAQHNGGKKPRCATAEPTKTAEPEPTLTPEPEPTLAP